MVRRGRRVWRGLGASIGLAAGFVALVVACSSDDAPAPAAPPPGSGLDAALIGESAPPPVPQPNDVPPGNVCGDKGGLQPTSSWPLPGGCSTRAGYSSIVGPQSAAIWWTAPALLGRSSPAVVGSGLTAWVGAEDGNIYQVSSGVVVAALPTGAPVRSSPAIREDGAAIIAGGDGVLYTLQPSNGTLDEDAGAPDGGDAAAPLYPRPEVVATYALGASASSPAIGGDGTTYIGTLAGKLVAVRADGATLAWTAVTNDTNGSSPAVGQDGTIYVGSSDHKLYAFREDGTSRWATDLGAEVKASPAVGGDGTIYIGTADGKLHALDQTGKERWTYATGGPIVETPAVYAGSVYVGSQDKSLHAVSVVDGSKQWTYATLGAVATPVVATDGTVYVGSADEHVYAITGKGSLLFAVTVRGRVFGSGAVTPGPVLMVPTDKGLVAVGP